MTAKPSCHAVLQADHNPDQTCLPALDVEEQPAGMPEEQPEAGNQGQVPCEANLYGASQQLVDEGQASCFRLCCCCHCCCNHRAAKALHPGVFAALRQAALYSCAMLSLSCCDQYILLQPLLLTRRNRVFHLIGARPGQPSIILGFSSN